MRNGSTQRQPSTISYCMRHEERKRFPEIIPVFDARDSPGITTANPNVFKRNILALFALISSTKQYLAHRREFLCHSIP